MYNFDLKSLKFQTVTGAGGDMKSAKTFNGIIHCNDTCLYAMGGNERDACERYDQYQNRWEVLQSYGELAQGTSELNGWCQLYVAGGGGGRPGSNNGSIMQ